MDKSKKPLKFKQWTERQIKQLPEPGYYLQIWKTPHHSAIGVYCIMNGYCRYSHNISENFEWWTLLWSCAPTRKYVANPPEGSRIEHFKTYEELKEVHPELTKFIVKAPNEF